MLFLPNKEKVRYCCYDDSGVDVVVLDDDKRRQLFTDFHDLLID
ncbi:TPA: DUF3885 domain-containing protein [Streptococcus suis]